MRPVGEALLLLTALICAICASVVSSARPQVIGSSVHSRVLQFARIQPDGSVRLEKLHFGTVDVMFNQPLYLSADYSDLQSSRVRVNANTTAIEPSLRNSVVVMCNETERIRLVPAYGTHQFRTHPPSLLLSFSQHNPIAELFHLYEPFDREDTRPANMLSFTVPLSHTNHLGQTTVIFESALLADCRVHYRTSSERFDEEGNPIPSNSSSVYASFPSADPSRLSETSQPRISINSSGSQMDSGVPSATITSQRASSNTQQSQSSSASSIGTGTIANFIGEEITMDVPLNRLAFSACEERFVTLLSNDTAYWRSEALRLHNIMNTTDSGAAGNISASDAHWFQSEEREHLTFLETQLGVGMPLAMMFKPIMSGVMKPVVKATVTFIQQDLMVVATSDLVNSVSEEVIPDVNLMLSEVLLANLTNILTDSVTHALTKSLALAFTRALGPYLVNTVSAKLTPTMHVILDRVLREKIPKGLNDFLPDLLDRVLPLTLMHSLTRGVTHALIPALTHTMTHDKRTDVWCSQCFYKKTHCSLCHFSPESMYYHIYHAAYYSDYYTDYYTDYYAEALMEVDAALYPESTGMKPGK